jgi:hypothetical protein
MNWKGVYRCGCLVGPKPKSEIAEVCQTHGDAIAHKYPSPTREEADKILSGSGMKNIINILSSPSAGEVKPRDTNSR